MKAVKNLMRITITEEMEVMLEKKLEEKLGRYPTKDEFYEETLKVLKKLDDIEEQMTMLSGRTYDNTDRIENLEKLHPNGKHSLPVSA